jgi:hypothetical protein
MAVRSMVKTLALLLAASGCATASLPLDTRNAPPGAGLVFATADFSAGSGVLIKIQVEELATIPGTEATVKVWAGNGQHPASSATPPSGGTLIYSTGTDVSLRHATEYLDRTYDEETDQYWLFVHVDHDTGSGREHRYLWWEWVPSQTSSPDTSHDFNQY